MTDRTAVPERVSQRAKTARRSGGSGSQAVGDYVGQPAGEAAQAVRRAGLRAGLDRSFGCPAELVGLVVAQDPAAGSGLARNGMVTLYVAAPGGEPLDGDDELAPGASGAADDELRAPEPADGSPSTTPVPARPRRRKRGRAQRPPTVVEPPPAPTMPGESASEHVPPQDAVEPLHEWPAEIDAPAGALEDEPTGELDEREVAHDDEFVVQVEDVLAGRSGPLAWRGAYPRATRGLRGRGRVRAWLGEHRMLAGTVGAALALWIVVGAVSVVDGHHPRTPAASALTPSRAPAVRHPVPTTKPPAAPKSTPPRTPTRSPRPHTAQHRAPRAAPSRPAQHRAPRPVHPVAPAVRETVLPAATPPTQPPARPSTAAPPPSTPPAPAPEQSGGGLFSP
jgi:PASTA domain-containing protein